MDLNHVTLTGVLEQDPITRFANHGIQAMHKLGIEATFENDCDKSILRPLIHS